MNLSFELETYKYCYAEANGSCVKGGYIAAAKPILYVFLASGTGVTITGNLVVIISIAHFKQLHTPTNMLVMSLALADLLLGVFVMPFNMIYTIEGCWYFGDILCSVQSNFYAFLTSASICHLIIIAFDRYQAVCNPLHYHNLVTIPVAWIMVTLSWLAAALYSGCLLHSTANLTGLAEYIAPMACLGSCYQSMDEFSNVFDAVFGFFFPCLVMVALYAKIFLVARQHVKQLGSKPPHSHLKPETSNNKSSSSERKAAKTLGIVVSVFILCWLPCFITSIVNPYTNFSTPAVIVDIFGWLGYFNSALNPVIYGFFYPWFQKTLKLIVSFKIFTTGSSDLNILL